MWRELHQPAPRFACLASVRGDSLLCGLGEQEHLRADEVLQVVEALAIREVRVRAALADGLVHARDPGLRQVAAVVDGPLDLVRVQPEREVENFGELKCSPHL